VLVAADAAELDLEDRGLGRPGQLLDAPERRVRDARLLSLRARKRVPGGEGVVHDGVVIGVPDAKT
jgi:hypothetical protein